MIENLSPYFSNFEPVGLDELNEKAALLTRSENKYLLRINEFHAILNELENHFQILTIDGNRIFNYKSLYFDTEKLTGYIYHNQGRTKRRFKVRTRQYMESGLCYFEVKLKDKRGGTVKKRMTYPTDNYQKITKVANKFFNRSYAEIYGHDFEEKLLPQLGVSYTRITLVAKKGGERVTIDTNMTFSRGANTSTVKPFLIVETKTADGRGLADSIFRKQGIRSRSCSKYCLGLNVLQFGVKYNKFKQLLKYYNSLPELTPAFQPIHHEPARTQSIKIGAPQFNPA